MSSEETRRICKQVVDALDGRVHSKAAMAAVESCKQVLKTVLVNIDDIIEWRKEWLEHNDPRDGTDCVTPFDKYFY